jgi:hypothetical protein
VLVPHLGLDGDRVGLLQVDGQAAPVQGHHEYLIQLAV